MGFSFPVPLFFPFFFAFVRLPLPCAKSLVPSEHGATGRGRFVWGDSNYPGPMTHTSQGLTEVCCSLDWQKKDTSTTVCTT
jgi:hypothetical protein